MQKIGKSRFTAGDTRRLNGAAKKFYGFIQIESDLELFNQFGLEFHFSNHLSFVGQFVRLRCPIRREPRLRK